MDTMGYCRVSTSGQANNGVSLEVQQEKIRAYAASQGLRLLSVIVETGSGTNAKRPGLLRLRAAVNKREIGGIIVYHSDRLFRDSAEQLAWTSGLLPRAGVQLLSVTDPLDTSTATGKAQAGFTAVVNQFMRDLISEKTTDALRRKRARGERMGNIRYGYQARPDGHLEKRPDEQRILSLIRRWRKKGETLRGIAAKLNERGLTTRRGSQWQHPYIQNLLRK